ncbi:MAG TPA: (d)CMP kinase [Candidatus Macondimonas sp.]|nr:(d)CMP kinase [Candidatus Macondimonas sp.]
MHEAALAPVICLDGPSGAGKGTVGRMLAQRLGWHFLDSGALYRLVAVAAKAQDIDLDAPERLADIASGLDCAFGWDARGRERILLGGREVTGEVRAETTGAAASRVARHPAVRAALLARQRADRRPPGLVADGRDMGTVVFPDAPLKIFLTASAEERARRRHKQLMEHGIGASIADLIQEIEARDRQDRERAVSPLVADADALIVDSTGQTPSQLCMYIVDLAQRRGLC